jgi:hypothetical protein
MSSLNMHLGPITHNYKHKKLKIILLKNKCMWWLDLVAHVFNPTTQKGKVGGRSLSKTFPRQNQALLRC